MVDRQSYTQQILYLYHPCNFGDQLLFNHTTHSRTIAFFFFFDFCWVFWWKGFFDEIQKWVILFLCISLTKYKNFYWVSTFISEKSSSTFLFLFLYAKSLPFLCFCFWKKSPLIFDILSSIYRLKICCRWIIPAHKIRLNYVFLIDFAI